ncbi:MAG: hypothetical protein K2X03_22805 [Bryobacteraceae bacterium]|nr:hypothetical protein [Bryobacteraceae bacterium]
MKPVWLTLVLSLAWGQLPPAVPPKPVAASTVPQWRVKFFHDKNDSAIDFRELVTPAPGVVYAFGILAEDRARPNGVLVLSRDAGKSWQTVRLPALPDSASFIDTQNGWLSTADTVHRTTDGGLTWRRAAKLKGVRRVKFLNAQRGFAVGYPKAAWSTADGGATWVKIDEAALPTAKPENSTYNTISFADSERGIITGFSRPPRRDDSRAPAWMDPENEKRQVPTLTLVLETSDGGKTWRHQSVSSFGLVAKTIFYTYGLGLMEFSAGSFAYPSEVIHLGTSKSVFAEKDKAIRDLTFDADGRAWIAGIELPGKLNQLPIPAKVVVMQTIDNQHWYPTPVSYRAVANNVRISFAGPKGWLATDQGMILALE